MKLGRSINEFALEVQRQNDAKRDFVVPVRSMAMDDFGAVGFEREGHSAGFMMSKFSHGQMADYLKIPRKYYETMRENDHLNLLKNNVNYWFDQADKSEKRMIRTLDGVGRAFLSSRYRRLDNKEVVEAVLPALASNDVQIMSSEITEKRLYIKAVFPKMEGEVAVGDVVQSGIMISNSEIGVGSVLVQPLIFRLVCANGMILPESKVNKYHIGRDQGIGDITYMLTDETLMANDRAFFMTIRDVVNSCVNNDIFQGHLGKLREAAGIKIVSDDVQKVVELTTRKFGLGDEVGSSILKNLIEGGDLSKWGLANSVTAVANNTDDYDLATNLESVGGDIIHLSRHEWEALAA